MKSTSRSLPWFGLMSLFVVALFLFAGSDSTPKDSMSSVVKLIEKYHYSPIPMDDQFSERVYHLFLKRIDPGKRFLTQADIDQLEKYKTRLDDDAKHGNLEFVALANRLLKARISEANRLFQSEISISQPFDSNETFETDPDRRSYYKDTKSFDDDWRRFIKYQILTTYLADAESSTSNESKAALKSLSPTFEKAARSKVEKNLRSYFDRLAKETDSDRIDAFINCIAMANDPHTQYLAPQQKDDFDINIKGSLEGIGAILEESDGYIKVNRIVPGGPAWKQKELKAQDNIVKVAQAGEEPVDIVGMRVQDAVKLIRGPKGSRVTLTVKKPEGKIVLITIVRDIVILEESYAKSAIIVDKDGSKIGYIVLPSFYRDFSNAKAHNASDDLRNELKKIISSGANEVILDLRNNGGGALDDAVKVSGLFIKHGPVVQVRDRNNNGYINEDHDPSVTFKGKLIILVNTFSASAAEIVTAALQDYKRAIVIGSAHTYGKGTVQTVVNLDVPVSTLSSGKSQGGGSLKVTNQKYFRVTGASTQFKGVEPDIEVPEINDYLDVGEKNQDYPLSWTTTSPTPIVPEGPTIPNEVLKNARKRIASDSHFRAIATLTNKLKNRRKTSAYPLNLLKASQFQKDSKSETDELDTIKITTPDITTMPSDEKWLHATEPERSADYKEWLTQIPKDIYIAEAVRILNDWRH